MKITATKVKAKDLKEGDLFSQKDQNYWDKFRPIGAIGEKVYIRTDVPVHKGEEKTEIYRITIK